MENVAKVEIDVNRARNWLEVKGNCSRCRYECKSTSECIEHFLDECTVKKPEIIFKPGDKVRVKTLEQLEKELKKDSDGDFICSKGVLFVSSMAKMCDQVFTIMEISDGIMRFVEDVRNWAFTPEMVEKL